MSSQKRGCGWEFDTCIPHVFETAGDDICLTAGYHQHRLTEHLCGKECTCHAVVMYACLHASMDMSEHDEDVDREPGNDLVRDRITGMSVSTFLSALRGPPSRRDLEKVCLMIPRSFSDNGSRVGSRSRSFGEVCIP